MGHALTPKSGGSARVKFSRSAPDLVKHHCIGLTKLRVGAEEPRGLRSRFRTRAQARLVLGDACHQVARGMVFCLPLQLCNVGSRSIFGTVSLKLE